MKYISGDKISLYKFDKSFITEEYIAWLNDRETTRYLKTGRFPVAEEDIEIPSGKDCIRFSIVANDVTEEKYVGTITLHRIDWINRNGEIGYLIGDKKYWGKGMATEAIRLICEYAFYYLNLKKIIARVESENIGSMKVLEKNGFKLFGINPQNFFLDGKYLDTHMFYKLRDA